MAFIELICVISLVLMALSVSFTASSLLMMSLSKDIMLDIFEKASMVASISIAAGLTSFITFVSQSSNPDAYIAYLVAYLVVILPMLVMYVSLLPNHHEDIFHDMLRPAGNDSKDSR